MTDEYAQDDGSPLPFDEAASNELSQAIADAIGSSGDAFENPADIPADKVEEYKTEL